MNPPPDLAPLDQAGDACRDAESARFLPTPRQFLVLLLAYLGLHLALHTLASDAIGIDEADQVALTQGWNWGYGPQPPLYSWLLLLFTGVLGPSPFTLTLLREVMLFAIYGLTYASARRITYSHACGVAAAVALQFHPTIVWESQRELTHSILASAMILAMLAAFFRMDSRRRGPWLAFGLFGGLSIISKYNAALFYAALLCAVLSLPGLRPRVLDRRMGLALLLTLAVILPNLAWMMTHRDLAFASVYKFHIQETAPWVETTRKGLRDWISTAGAHAGVVVAILAIIFLAPIRAGKAPSLRIPEARLLWRTFLILCLMVVLSVLVLRVTSFKDRWLQPIFVSLPLFLILAFREGLDRARLKAILSLGALVGLAVLVMASGRLLLVERMNKREVLNAPFRKLAPDLAPLVGRADFVVAEPRWLAGNLRLWFPQKRIVSADMIPFYPCAGQHGLLVWETGRETNLPPALANAASQLTGRAPTTAPGYLEERWRYHRAKNMRLGVLAIERAFTTAPPKAPGGSE